VERRRCCGARMLDPPSVVGGKAHGEGVAEALETEGMLIWAIHCCGTITEWRLIGRWGDCW
jgi:hypothetical protein